MISNQKIYKLFSILPPMNHVSFYFWNHYSDSFNPEVIKPLLQQSDILFEEGLMAAKEGETLPDILQTISRKERVLNRYLTERGIMRPLLRESLQNVWKMEDSDFQFYDLMEEDQCIVLERPHELITASQYDSLKRNFNPYLFALEEQVPYVLRDIEQFRNGVRSWFQWQQKCEDAVAQQIVSLDQSVLVVFGSGHRRLAELVSKDCSVSTHFPYENYPLKGLLTTEILEGSSFSQWWVGHTYASVLRRGFMKHLPLSNITDLTAWYQKQVHYEQQLRFLNEFASHNAQGWEETLHDFMPFFKSHLDSVNHSLYSRIEEAGRTRRSK